jgi:hypothetical protein
MITPELEAYVQGELGRGASKESIRENLLKNGWATEDVEQVFAAISPSFVPPFVPPAHIEPGRAAVSGTDMKPHRTHKKAIMISIAVLFLLLAGGGAYAYYSGSFLSLPSLAARSMANARDAKSASYDITVNVDFSELKDSGLGLGDMLGTGFNSKQFGITAKGQYDISDPDNFKNSLVVSVMSGSFAPELELRMLEDTLYGKLSKIPTLSLFTMLSSIENKWFSFKYKSDDGQIANNPVTAIVGIDTSTMNRLTDDQKEKIYEMAREASFIKIIKKLPPETVTGESAYHFTFVLDREGISDYLQELKEYVNSVGVDDSALSIFDPTVFDKELDSLKDFSGEMWIGRSDKLPRKLSMNFGIQPDETESGMIKIKTMSIFDGWNEPVVIEIPADSMPFEEFLSGMMSGALSEPASGDQAIKAGLSNLRAEAELFWNDNPETAYLGFCSSEVVKNSRKAIEAGGGKEFSCKDTKTAWAAGAKLPDSSGYWCVDSEGSSKSAAARINGTVCK